MDNAQWHYGQDGRQLGPVDTATLRQLAASGQLRPGDLVWRDGMTDWIPASTVPELAGAFTAAPAGPAGPVGGAMPPTGVPMGYEGYPPGVPNQNGKANTSMGLGIGSIVLALCCPLVGLGLGIAAVVTSKGVTNTTNPGAAKAGFICGIVGIVLSVLNGIAGIALQVGGGGNRFGF